MTQSELNEVIRLHKMWLNDEPNGVRANLSGADLYGADLYGADLYGANLSGADLSGADLSGADLYGANLSGANLSGANLSRAYLSGANLSRAYLSGANLSRAVINNIIIAEAVLYTGLYKYTVMAIISDTGEKYVKMGCFLRKLSEWEADFWNNDKEFPKDGSEKSQMRLLAYNTAKEWFKIIEKKFLDK